jgi:hypothetical protein
MKENKATYPHCDSRVLHGPNGKCRFCDEYPELQQERIRTNTNFTGEQDLTKNPCPAEKQRSLRDINKWSGNRPEPWPRIQGIIVNRGADVH